MNRFPLIIMALLPFVLCSCPTTDGPRKIGVAWSPGYVYVPRCQPLVKYQGKSFEIKGIKVPVPQLGGAAEIGGVSVDPKILNQAYQTTQILDAAYHQNCELLPSSTTDKETFQQAVQRMENSQTKLQQLALSLQTGNGTAQSPQKKPKDQEGPGGLGPAVETGSGMAGEAPAEPAAARSLTKWVQSYAKGSKAAVIDTPAKANSTLGLPATSDR